MWTLKFTENEMERDKVAIFKGNLEEMATPRLESSFLGSPEAQLE